VTETDSYDHAGRPTNVTNLNGSSVPSEFTQTLDPVGNPTLIATTRGITTTNEAFAYDANDRILKDCNATSCSGTPDQIAYAYDKEGNQSPKFPDPRAAARSRSAEMGCSRATAHKWLRRFDVEASLVSRRERRAGHAGGDLVVAATRSVLGRAAAALPTLMAPVTIPGGKPVSCVFAATSRNPSGLDG
jgi:hypothetical protein